MRPRPAANALRADLLLLLLLVPLASLATTGCRQPRSKVVSLSPEVAELQAQDTGHARGADAASSDASEAQLIYRRSRTDERARLATVSDALTRLGLLDAQIEQEAASPL